MHGTSFHYFRVDERLPEFRDVWESVSVNLVPSHQTTGSIFMGDFNSQYRYTLIQPIADGTLTSSFASHPAQLHNSLNDDILVTTSLDVVSLERITTPSDHDFLRARVARAS